MKWIFVVLLFAAMHASGQSKPFSNYQVYNGMVFVSGQIGKTDTGISFEQEADAALKNVMTVLKEAKAARVLNVTVYLTDISLFDTFNSVYRRYFDTPFPARTCVVVNDLVQHARVEISVIAVSHK